MKRIWSIAALAVITVWASGAARAQAPVPTETYKAGLTTTAEVPPNTSGGGGSAVVTLYPANRIVDWDVEFSGLSAPATAAHIHCGAAPGANAGVAVPLVSNLTNPPGPPNTSPIKGRGPMTDPQIALLRAGQCYVNVHTAANPGGAIRGQLERAP
jgi:hypothetical protein